MANLSTKIKMYCDANGVSEVDFMKDVMLQDDSDGNGAYIKEWNLDIAQPTDAQLSAQESAANKEEANSVVRSTRRTAYGDIGEQLDEIYKDIDTKPTIGNFQICDAISVVNGQAAYTMQVGSVNVIPQSANHMIVSLNGTIQKPNSSFTVSGSTITFASNLATGDVIDFIQILGDVLDLGVPSDATVTAAKLNNDIISGSTELASEPADTDEFLVSDAGTLKRIDYSLIKGGGITEADQWRLSATLTGVTSQYITANLERVDNTGWGKIGTGMSESSGVFTFPSTGIWLVKFQFLCYASSTNDGFVDPKIHITTNNSSYAEISRSYAGHPNNGGNIGGQGTMCESLIDVTDTSNVKIKFYIDSLSTSTYIYGATDTTGTGFSFIRLGDT